MDSEIVNGQSERQGQEQGQKDNTTNCLKKNFFPNYISIIFIAVSVASIITTIIVVIVKSNSSSEEKKMYKVKNMGRMIFPQKYQKNHGKNIKEQRNIYISGNITHLIILLICAKSIILLEFI